METFISNFLELILAGVGCFSFGVISQYIELCLVNIALKELFSLSTHQTAVCFPGSKFVFKLVEMENVLQTRKVISELLKSAFKVTLLGFGHNYLLSKLSSFLV